MEKKIDEVALKELEASKNEVLKRVSEKLKSQLDGQVVCGGHSSHTSGSGRGHNSTTSH